MQFPDAYQSYLVESVEDCAERTLDLLDDAEKRRAFGIAGREKVRSEFLLPRLIRDELRLISELLAS